MKTVDRVALPLDERVQLDGKFFRLSDQEFWVEGVTYGPFEPRSDGVCLPPHEQLEADLAQIAETSANTIRVCHVPPRDLLELAHSFGIKVFLDVPWSKHRCFLESSEDMESGRHAVREAARGCKGHPAILGLSVVNELPADVVRSLGRERVERYIDELVAIAHQEDPGILATFASFPPTEYLHPPAVDFFYAAR